MYTVSVGNIGNIEYKTLREAKKCFSEYVEMSKSRYGRASHENVVLLDKNNEIIEAFYNSYNDHDLDFEGN